MGDKLATVGANALAMDGPIIKPIYGSISDEEKLRKLGIDPAAATEEIKATMIALYDQQKAEEGAGTFVRYKLLKDSRNFETPAGDAIKEIRGVIVTHSRMEPSPRTRWEEGKKLPVCKSLDGVTGTYTDKDGRICEQGCANCERNSRSTAFNPNMPYNEQCKASGFVALLAKDIPVPVLLTLSPTQIKHAKEYIEKKIGATGRLLIAQETVITLGTESNDKGTWSVPQFALGDPLPPAEIYRLAQEQKKIKAMLTNWVPEKEDIQGEAPAVSTEPY